MKGNVYEHIILGVEASETNSGVQVDKVYTNSLVHKKLIIGDVIQSLNGSRINSTHDLLYYLFIAKEYNNSEILLKILRDGRIINIKL
jgi:S1-C subfamily serine protease